MGKRCRWAALGATFALLVASCAANDDSLTEQSNADIGPDLTASSVEVPERARIEFADVGDGSFALPRHVNQPCDALNSARITMLSLDDGTERWALPFPEPGTLGVVHEQAAFISTRSSNGQPPGVASVDLETRSPAWQLFLEAEVLDLSVEADNLIVVTRNAVRAIDLATGEEQWVNNGQFDFENVILASGVAYALDNVGVKAIDLFDGRVLWTLDDVPRADTISFADNTIAVAAQTRIVTIDIRARGRLWDISDADRLGAGEIWTSPLAVYYEVSPNVAPGGGVTALDRTTGQELWSVTNVGSPVFVGNGQLLTSRASGDPSPGEPFVFIALDPATGEQIWQLSSTTEVFDAVVGSTNGTLVISDPHPSISGFTRVRIVDSRSGEVVRQAVTSTHFDGATLDNVLDTNAATPTAALFGTTSIPEGNTGQVALIASEARGWAVDLPGGVSQEPLLTSSGVLVASPSQTSCIARLVGEPSQVVGNRRN